jgi:hypothetical protein
VNLRSPGARTKDERPKWNSARIYSLLGILLVFLSAMISSPSPLQILGTVLAALFIRSLLRTFVFRHPLDCIPGPPSKNILVGPSFRRLSTRGHRLTATTSILGNLPQIFSADPRGFYRTVSEKCTCAVAGDDMSYHSSTQTTLR